MRWADTRPRVRSALFMPAQRAEFLARADTCGADAVILDLEDAVAASGKPSARGNAGSWLEGRSRNARPAAMVRVNGIDTSAIDHDLAAGVGENLAAVLLPKVRGADDVRELSERLSWLEGRRGVPLNSVAIWPIIETAAAVSAVEQIAAASPRVAFLGGGTSEEGDLAREIGFEWTVEGLETLYIRSKVLVAARAHQIHNPMTGLVSGLADMEGVERFARHARQLGYSGMMVIHPSHVEVANRVFTPSASEVARAREVMQVLDAAALNGIGAVDHDGRMIDVAMARTAERLLADADRIRAVDDGR